MIAGRGPRRAWRAWRVWPAQAEERQLIGRDQLAQAIEQRERQAVRRDVSTFTADDRHSSALGVTGMAMVTSPLWFLPPR